MTGASTTSEHRTHLPTRGRVCRSDGRSGQSASGRPIRTLATSALLVVSAFATGCGADGSRSGTIATVRDSAGIEIVESRMPDHVISLSATPLVELGGDEHAMTFYGVTAILALKDGRFVVVDNGSKELRYFDATGRHERTAGGEGSGPGEYRSFSWAQRLRADTLAVYDSRSRRVSLLDDAGTYVEALNYRPQPPAPADNVTIMVPSILSGLFADRSGLIFGDQGFLPGSVEGLQTVNGVMLRHDFAGARHDTLFAAPLMDHYWRPGAMSPSPVVFSPRLSRVTAGQTVFMTTGRSYEVRRYTSDAVLQRVSRAAIELRAVTESHREAYADGVQAQEDAVYAAALPAYWKLIWADGDIWAIEYKAPGADTGVAHIYDDRGALTSVVEFPGSFTPHDVRDDRVYGVHRDELGVETVRIYRPTAASASAGTR